MWPWSRIKALEDELELTRLERQMWRERFEGQEAFKVYDLRIKSLCLGIGRLIGKLEPLYGIPEDSPERRAASDKLGQDIINRLQAEHKAANHSTGGNL